MLPPKVYIITCNCCNNEIGYVAHHEDVKLSIRHVNKLLKQHRQKTGCSPYKIELVSNLYKG